jgi:pyrimidine-nucleoside phosphorylase
MTAAFRAVDAILAKREGSEHARAELEALVRGYVAGDIPDYQMAAWLMAVCFQGMTERETAWLTLAMAHSGEVLDLRDLPHTVDKHSTGGVGDKTTLVLAPLLAAIGGTVAKMSGRGLGHTGGTVDKLESIPGFRTDLDVAAFLRQAREVGVVVTGQSMDLAPADGMMYALRDATGTVASLPLIASSVMSKKLAGGADVIVLDVKVGSGAFMKTLADARALARTMVAIGEHAGRRVRAVLTNMTEPLGFAVGNAVEVEEAAACLRGEGPEDLLELCLTLAERVLDASGLPSDRATLQAAVDSGRAFERFERWIAAQGGDPNAVGHLERAPDAWHVRAPADGVVRRLDALAIGRAVGALGGGRSRKGEAVDAGVGVILQAKVGHAVTRGDAIATVLHRGGKGLDVAKGLLEGAVTVSDAAEPAPLILDRDVR